MTIITTIEDLTKNDVSRASEIIDEEKLFQMGNLENLVIAEFPLNTKYLSAENDEDVIIKYDDNFFNQNLQLPIMANKIPKKVELEIQLQTYCKDFSSIACIINKDNDDYIQCKVEMTPKEEVNFLWWYINYLDNSSK